MIQGIASRLLDNHERGAVGQYLRQHIREGAEMSVVSAFFTIYAYEALQQQLNQIKHMRFLFGEPNFVRHLEPGKSVPQARIEQDSLSLEHTLRQGRVAQDCARWLAEKVEVRSVRKPGFVHGKLYHIRQGDYERAVLGSSNFTVRGLGLSQPSNIELNFEVTDSRDQQDLQAWFESLWNHPDLVEDVKEQVLRQLERLYTPVSPQLVYFKTLYHLFAQQPTDASTQLKQPQRLYDSQIWQTLFEFQRHGAEATIRKLLQYGGCVLADSVGLGKTYTALAVIKYFENLNDKVLVLSPKKLRENWTLYQAHNHNAVNPFPQDRFGYTVLSHTDLSRQSGRVGDIDLATFNWSNFDLVVIDESHNFRNNTKSKRDSNGEMLRKSRYERLMQDILQSGARTKVLLLSATPVNTELSDLRNQLMLLSGNSDNAFAESLGVSSVRDVLAVAQREFNQWASKEDRSVEGLLERLNPAFFSLLDGLTLARSRQHIRTHYAHEVERLGGFPHRHAPQAVFAAVDGMNFFPSYDAVHQQIDLYRLALFSPLDYVLPQYRSMYERDTVQRNFSQANRERYLIGMMKVNFLKRLESSVHSFAITLQRTCQKIRQTIHQIESYQQQHQQSHPDWLNRQLEDLEDDDEDLQELLVGGQIQYDLRHLDLTQWLHDLNADLVQLDSIAQVAQMVTPARDAKLQELKNHLLGKLHNPTLRTDHSPNRKVLVFTAFADTAHYLYDQLKPLAQQKGVHIALVVGSGQNQTTLGVSEFNAILTNFSPRSKRRSALSHFPQEQEVDWLIATDCISEGQNLQDCDCVINYDIHWNPVRLIQRFGRIDRIGSQNPSIQMINFWPTPDLNAYLNLKNRVEARMALVDLTATAQDNPLSPEQAGVELSYRDQQLLRLKDQVLDLEDLEGGVSLTHFSLDDFRMDLNGFLEANRQQLESAPLGLMGLVGENQGAGRAGIIFCLRQTQGATQSNFNPLGEHFLLYVRNDGTVRYGFTQPKQTLDLYRALCAQQTQANPAMHDWFDRHTHGLTNLSQPNQLLQKALESIRGSFRRKLNQSVLSGGRGVVVPNLEEQLGADTPFELITWLVILQPSE